MEPLKPLPSIFLLMIFVLVNYSSTAHNKSLQNESSFDVGVILGVGNDTKICMSLALEDFTKYHNYSISKLPFHLHWKYSNDDVVNAASIAQELLQKKEVKAIIGPKTSAQAQFIAELGDKARIPIISFSATSPLLSANLNPYFIRTALNDSSQVRAIAAIIQAFSWREVVCIYEDTVDYGSEFILDLTDALQEINARVVYKRVISHLASDDRMVEELLMLAGLQSRVFVVHLSPSQSSRLFLKANENMMMSKGYVWIVTDSVTNHLNSMNSTVIQSMQGVLGVKPYIPKSKELDNFKERYTREFRRLHSNVEIAEINVYGLWAYDTIWALAMAAERSLRTRHLHSLKQQSDGSRLRDALLETKFKGLSGEFNLISGQLDSLVFEVVNVIGKGEREIGFWTPANGLEEELSASKRSTHSTSKDVLKTIIWPGDPKIVPKGWEFPSSGKKLRIGVPKKHRFLEFVNVKWDAATNRSTVTGYSIDVFEAAIKRLPYAVYYDYVPYIDMSGNAKGSYNDLINEVYRKNFDAVVADTTILYNRSLRVDFTMPYSESGVTLLARVNYKRNNAWIFLRPLSLELWFVTVGGFVFTGLAVWALEHPVNEEFTGSPSQQVGVMLWFSFSTLVFAHSSVPRNITSFLLPLSYVQIE